MNLKRIAAITLCASLALMVILLTVVLIELAPVLGLLFGTGGPNVNRPPQTTPPNTQTTVPATQATQPTTVPTDPTAATTAPTEPATKPTEPAHEHSFEKTSTVDADCETSGYEMFTCSGCGKVELRNYTNALGHAFGAGQLVNPTCTEEGYTEYECSRCGKNEKRNVTEALGHEMELKEEHEATCTEDGYKLYKCTRCDEEEERDVVRATGHTFGEWTITTEPGPGIVGEQTRECEVCGETEARPNEVDKKVDHTEEGGKKYYTARMVAKDSKGDDVTVYSYTVVDGSYAGDMTFTPGENGEMTVQFTKPDGTQFATTLNPGDTLILDENGNMVSQDAPTLPSEPVGTTDPEPDDSEE